MTQKDRTIQILQLAVDGKLPESINAMRDDLGYLIPHIGELIADGLLRGRIQLQSAYTFAELEKMENPPMDAQVEVAVGLRITAAGRDRLHELKSRTFWAVARRRALEEGVRIVVAVVIAILVYLSMEAVKKSRNCEQDRFTVPTGARGRAPVGP